MMVIPLVDQSGKEFPKIAANTGNFRGYSRQENDFPLFSVFRLVTQMVQLSIAYVQ
jgi:hypothetical protein